MKIKNEQLVIYEVNSDYRNYLRKFDSKVSLKDNRRFYGILVTENNIDYCIPFTCKIKKRNSKLTINVKNKNKTIAQLLINNMIPINDKVITKVDIKNDKQRDYLNNEIIFLRNKEVKKEILTKTSKMLNIMKTKKGYDYEFFKAICCNFELLEREYNNY